MKLKLAMLFIGLVVLCSFAASARSYVGFDFVVPNDGTLYGGIISGPLTLEASIADLFVVPPVLSLTAEYLAKYSYWNSDLNLWINDIDFVTTYPIPIATDMGFSWRGTIHVGTLVGMLAEPPQTTSSSIIDIYGEVKFQYDWATSQLVPSGGFGFYWEP